MNKTNLLLDKCLEHLARLPNIQLKFGEASQILSDKSIIGLLTITCRDKRIKMNKVV